MQKDKTHFVGSVVQVQKDEEHGVKPFIIIDGQQRLTTIYLLLKAMHDVATRENTKEDLADSLFNKFKDDPSKRDDKNKLKLKANTEDNKQLILLMDGKFDEINKESTVYTNYEYFKNLVNEIIKSDEYEAKDLKRGVEKLTAVVISLKEEHGDDPQVIFERINSTGVDLGLDDKIRNFVLMTNMNQEVLFDNYWAYIEKNIPKVRREQFFIDFLNSYTTYKVSKENAYDFFKKWAGNKNHEDILRQLKKVAKFYSAFIANSKDYSRQINEKLEAFRRINQSTIYVFLFHIFTDFEDEKISEDILLSVLSLFLNYSIRRIVCEVQSNSLRGLYKTLYNRIFSGVEDVSKYYDACVSMLVENLKNTKDVLPKDSDFLRGLCEMKIYRNPKLCKFLLGLLENNNSNEKIDVDSEKITIEHIMPQNHNNADWRKHIGDDFDRVYTTYLDTLGNVTLTGYNEKLSDNAFDVKQRKLNECDTKIKFLNKEYFESIVWNEKIIISRAERLAKATNAIFPYPAWSGINYHPVNIGDLIKITLHSIEDTSGKETVSYEFMGERKEVFSFRETLSEMINTLYMLNENILQSLAQSNFKLQRAERTYLTYNQSNLRKAEKIDNAEIYFEINLSGQNTLQFIKELLNKYEIDENEFVLYCKQSLNNALLKNEALILCKDNGIDIDGNMTFASKNNAKNFYWANPNIKCLKQNWWIILSDTDKKELYIFNIPANTLLTNRLKPRVGYEDRLDIQIGYDDVTFRDGISNLEFSQWHKKTIAY